MVGEPRAPWTRQSALWVVLTMSFALATTPLGAVQLPGARGADTSGVAQMQWAYDSWTVPWVQVRGIAPALAPASHVTLMTLSCETANLERDRLARHLSAEECEHRMAAIRGDQDSALTFRLDLRVFDFRGMDQLVRLAPGVVFRLEDDRSRQWGPIQAVRGPVLQVATGQKLRRIYYYPPWMRSSQRLYAGQYDVRDGRNLTIVEHRLRFARRDPQTQELVLTPDTQWVRLRISYLAYEWVATWAFRTSATEDR